MTPGQHVRILAQPYEGREGVVVLVDPSGPRFQHWPVWVNVQGYDDGPKGFERHELAVIR